MTEFFRRFSALFFVVCPLLFLGCKAKEESRIVIWTDCSEFAQYIEFFNHTHTSEKAVLVFKDNPALSLPPAADELVPDIVIGSWLRSDSMARQFKSLEYLFEHKKVSSDIFYQSLLSAGKTHKTQYLLPVSFNLPAIIFSPQNEELVEPNYTLSPSQIRSIALSYNQKKASGALSRIGFAPLSNDAFLYLMTRLYNVDFRDEKQQIVWENDALRHTVSFLREWVQAEGSSAQEELDFAFKYLFMSDYRQVFSGRTLFAYTTSDRLFTNMQQEQNIIDYRWIAENQKLPIEDSFYMMGIYRNAQNQIGATEFISWFFDSANQEEMLARKTRLNLNTEIFGIAGGFSAVQYVTENILPFFYTQLLSNLPPSQLMEVPEKLPARWESYKSMVIEPYIKAAVSQTDDEESLSITELENEWRKKVYD